MKTLMISADNFEDLELFYPLHRLKEEGVTVELASMKGGIDRRETRVFDTCGPHA